MATSGSVSFSMTAKQVIDSAFSKIGVKVAEQELEAFEFADGKLYLNMMIKAMGAQGLHLWTKDEGILFLDAGKSDYLLGPQGDEACQLDDFAGTTSTTDHIATDTVITVTDTTNMLAGDNYGQELDNNTRHWTTIVTVDSLTQITITTGLPSGSASGSSVITFPNTPNTCLLYTSPSPRD